MSGSDTSGSFIHLEMQGTGKVDAALPAPWNVYLSRGVFTTPQGLFHLGPGHGRDPF